MTIVHVPLGERAYDIEISGGLLDRAGDICARTLSGRKVLVAFDAAVEKPWADRVASSIAAAGFEVHRHSIPTGERSKCTTQLDALWNAMAERDFARDSALVAVGGGVVGDLGGFAAASFLRGIDLVHVPTSLLAMVDSSVGGKTGINLAAGKNLVGAFWQPRLVLMDPEGLTTLPIAEFRSGMAEIVKNGVIFDADLFAFLEKAMPTIARPEGRSDLLRVIARSAEIKATVVAADERESGLRRILNFGHTLGHALEAEGGYKDLRHGEAVAIGMVAVSLLTTRRSVPGWPMAEHERLERLLEVAGLPTRIPAHMGAESLLDRTRVDKKVAKGVVRYVLPTKMGEVQTVNDVKDEEVVGVCRALGAR